MIHDKSYNDRLFKGGFRKWLHEARFNWLEQMVRKYDPDLSCVLELGCFDGRALKYIGAPARYFGFDADWEGGLESARREYQGVDACRFIKCTTPDQLDCGDEVVSCALSLETLEHIPIECLDGYLKKIASLLVDGGLFFVSVPNEKGPVFFFKHIVKTVFFEGGEKYTLREFFWASLGRLDKVERFDHKGFDWSVLQKQLEESFSLIEVGGIQVPWLPLSLNASIGMVFRKPNGPSLRR